MQGVEDREARVAEARRELERPDAGVVDDRVEVDVAHVAVVAQDARQAPQRRLEQPLGAAVRDERPHLARQLAEVAVEEPLVLPVQAGGGEEALAVEVRADAHLDAGDVLHEHEVRLLVVLPARALYLERGDDVGAVVELAHVVAEGGEARAVHLEHPPPAALAHEADRRREGLGPLEPVHRRDPAVHVLRTDALPEGSVAFEPGAERAAADDVVALRSQLAVERAVHRPLEDDRPLGPRRAHPRQLGAPVVHEVEHPAHDAPRRRTIASHVVRRVDAHVVPRPAEPEIHVA